MSESHSKILIVEDDVRMRTVIGELMAAPCLEFLQAGNGTEGLARFYQHRPDWVIMDIEMPGMDGLRATRKIREEFPDARIIILTIHDSPEMRQAALDAGACAFVSKDNLSQLGSILDQAAPQQTNISQQINP